MFTDARKLRSGAVIETDVCIVGGGVAGIAMALEFERAGIAVVLLESGGFARDEATSDLCRGSSIGIPYDFADGTRSRFLGGSSNCWGGFCRPWDEEAFARRDWVTASGWPIGRGDLEPYYTRAHSLLRVPTENYRPEYWVGTGAATGAAGLESGRARPYRLPVDPEKVEEIISQFSTPLKLGEAYRQDLEFSRRISVHLWANVTEIQCNPWASEVESVRLRTLGGVEATVKARASVLAAGGIENARLLLESRRQQATGLGNGHDLVGRYFQDHPRIFNGKVEFADPYRHNPLYDIKFHCIADDLTIAGARISGQLRLPFAVQRRERLLDAEVWFRSLYAGEGEEVVRALYRLRQRARGKWSLRHGLAQDLMEVMMRPASTLLYSAAHAAGSRRMVRSVTMEMIVEPEPDPLSRVQLDDEVDALGMRRAKVDWRLTNNVVRTVDRTFELVAAELRNKGIANIALDSGISSRGWPGDLEGTYHHMGTTRMHDSPRHGVVDRNCQVHGIANLHVAGSSVFPTSSSNHPTMTLAALALRLADRIIEQIHARERVKVTVPATVSAAVPAQPHTAPVA
jgi:choline dehydrogenase-like flavoprotein